MSRCASGCGGIDDLSFDVSTRATRISSSSFSWFDRLKSSGLLTATSAQSVRLVLSWNQLQINVKGT